MRSAVIVLTAVLCFAIAGCGGDECIEQNGQLVCPDEGQTTMAVTTTKPPPYKEPTCGDCHRQTQQPSFAELRRLARVKRPGVRLTLASYF